MTIDSANLELAQNVADFMKIPLEAAACEHDAKRDTPAYLPKIVSKPKVVRWTCYTDTICSARWGDRFHCLEQIGYPLSVGTLSLGTRIGRKNDADGEAGGFGDGFKSAALAFVCRGHQLVFEFSNFDEREPTKVLRWVFVAKESEEHPERVLGVDIEHDFEARNDADPFPRMRTIVRYGPSADDDERRELRHSFFRSLCRITNLVYELPPIDQIPVSDDCVRDSDCGAWFSKKLLTPHPHLKFGDGFVVAPPSEPVILVKGILYPTRTTPELPAGLVIVNPTKGLNDNDRYQVFKGPHRIPDRASLGVILSLQLQRFFETRPDTLCHLLQPFYHGGTSLILNRPTPTDGSGPDTMHTLVTHVIQGDHFLKQQVRCLLLRQKVLDQLSKASTAPPTDEEVQRKAATAILVPHGQYAKTIKYLSWMTGDCMITVPAVADPTIFAPTNRDWVRHRATYAARKALDSGSEWAHKLPSAVQACVDFVIGNDGNHDVVMVVPPADLADCAHNFTFGDTTVVSVCPNADGDGARVQWLMNVLLEVQGWSKERQRRSLALSRRIPSDMTEFDHRVHDAIANAKQAIDDEDAATRDAPDWQQPGAKAFINMLGSANHNKEVTLTRWMVQEARWHVEGEGIDVNVEPMYLSQTRVGDPNATGEKARNERADAGKRKQEGDAKKDAERAAKRARTDTPKTSQTKQQKRPMLAPSNIILSRTEVTQKGLTHTPPEQLQCIQKGANTSRTTAPSNEPDDPGLDCVFDSDQQVYRAHDDSPLDAEATATLATRKHVLSAAIDEVGAAGLHNGHSFYAAWMPSVTWEGMHFGTTVLVNLALVNEFSEMVSVLCHELAHHFSDHHDLVFLHFFSKMMETMLDHLQ